MASSPEESGVSCYGYDQSSSSRLFLQGKEACRFHLTKGECGLRLAAAGVVSMFQTFHDTVHSGVSPGNCLAFKAEGSGQDCDCQKSGASAR